MWKIFLLILFAVSTSLATIRTWTAADSSNDLYFDNDANWSGSSKPTGSDTALFDATGGSKAPTFRATASFGGLIIRSAYTRAFANSGYQITLASVCSVGTGGAVTLTGKLLLSNGPFTWNVAGTNNTANCSLFIAGTTDIKNYKSAAIWGGINAAYTDKTVTFVNSGNIIPQGNPGIPTLTLNGGAFIVNSSLGVRRSTSGQFIKYNSPTQLQGSAAISFQSVGTINDTLDDVRSAITSSITIGTNSSAGAATHYLKKIIAAGTVTLTGGSAGALIYDTIRATDSISCTNLYMNSVAPEGITTIRFINSPIIIPTSIGASISDNGTTNLCKIYFGGASIKSQGSVALGSGWELDAGTSRFITYGTGSGALRKITSNGKRFYTVVDSGNTGTRDSIVDNLSCYDHYIKQSKFKFGGHNDTVSGTGWFWSSSDSLFCETALASLIFSGTNQTWSMTGTSSARLLDSLQVKHAGNLSYVSDSNNTVYSITPLSPAGDTLTLQADKTLSLKNAPSLSWSGTTANKFMMRSSSSSKTRIAIPASKSDTSLILKNIAIQGYPLYDTTDGVNLFGDSNVVFRATNGLYMTPSIPTISSVSPSSGPRAGGYNDTLFGSEFFEPCSLSKDGGTTYSIKLTIIDSTKAWFTRAAAPRGSENYTVKNVDSNTVTLNGAFTSLAEISITSTTAIRGPSTGGGYDTIIGTGFFPPCSISINGGLYSIATVIDSTRIVRSIPAGFGIINYTIKNADNQVVTKFGAYRYLSPGGDTLILEKGKKFIITSLDSLDWSGSAATVGGRNYILSSQLDTLVSSRDTLDIPGTRGFSNLYMRNQKILYPDTLRCKVGCKSGGGNY